MKKWRGLNKTEKGTVIFASTLILFSGCLSGYFVYADKQRQEEIDGANQVVIANKSMLEDKGKIKAFINDLVDSKGYLHKEINQEKISKTFDQLMISHEAVKSVEKQVKEKKMISSYNSVYEAEKQLLENIQKKFLIQQSINKMFESKDNKIAIAGSEVNKELPIIKDVNDKNIEYDQKELMNISNDDWKKAVSMLLEVVKTQKEQMNEAINLVNGLFDKEKPKTDVSNENYDKAKTAVDKVKNEVVKKELTVKLEKVRKVLDERAKKEKQEKQREEANNAVEPSANPEMVAEASDVKEPVQEQAQADVVTPTETGMVAENNGNEATGDYSAPVATSQAPQNTGNQGTGAGVTQPQQPQSSNNLAGQQWYNQMIEANTGGMDQVGSSYDQAKSVGEKRATEICDQTGSAGWGGCIVIDPNTGKEKNAYVEAWSN